MKRTLRLLAVATSVVAALAFPAAAGAQVAAGPSTPANDSLADASTAVLAWSPSGTHDYGAVLLGETASKTFTLSNSDGGSSGKLTITLSGPAAFTITDDTCSGTSLNAKKSCAVTVRFAPTTFGQSSATLAAAGKHASESIVTLTGSGASTFVTHSQDEWGDVANPAGSLLLANFDAVYIRALEVGLPGTSGFSMRFFTPLAVFDYLPASGPAAQLTQDLINPTSSSAGIFGGDTLALQIDVDFADAGLLGGSASLRFGDLRLCGLDTSVAALNGLTVRQVLGVANSALGGGPTPVFIDLLDPLVIRPLTTSFLSGVPSPFAQAHLVAGACP